jgi:hypothetical protein
LQAQEGIGISQTIPGTAGLSPLVSPTFQDSRVITWLTDPGDNSTYGLLVEPWILSLDEFLVEDLEMDRRPAKGRETEVQSVQQDLQQRVSSTSGEVAITDRAHLCFVSN